MWFHIAIVMYIQCCPCVHHMIKPSLLLAGPRAQNQHLYVCACTSVNQKLKSRKHTSIKTWHVGMWPHPGETFTIILRVFDVSQQVWFANRVHMPYVMSNGFSMTLIMHHGFSMANEHRLLKRYEAPSFVFPFNSTIKNKTVLVSYLHSIRP